MTKTTTVLSSSSSSDNPSSSPAEAASNVVSSLKNSNVDTSSLLNQFTNEVQEITSCLGIALGPFFQSDDATTAEAIVLLCDELDDLQQKTNNDNDETTTTLSHQLSLRRRALEFKRYELLVKLLRHNYDSYVATASFLSPSRIPRNQLPNVQDIPYDKNNENEQQPTAKDDDGLLLVADCELDDMIYQENLLDTVLLSIFRKLVEQNTNGVQSDQKGIDGLLEQGRTFMLQEGQTPEAQHQMVSDTLAGLMTPVLPPFYRIFMSGIVPKLGTEYDGKQVGPWFYAPWLTSIVTPTFFGFLVGPSKPNRRKDGALGGLVVEKCKFLQQSGCKGLCLHQCKLPAQQFFDQTLGLPLTVTPNFVTQECQWSFGEIPVPPDQDPSFPKGCLVGCESRQAMTQQGRYADVCN